MVFLVRCPLNVLTRLRVGPSRLTTGGTIGCPGHGHCVCVWIIFALQYFWMCWAPSEGMGLYLHVGVRLSRSHLSWLFPTEIRISNYGERGGC